LALLLVLVKVAGIFLMLHNANLRLVHVLRLPNILAPRRVYKFLSFGPTCWGPQSLRLVWILLSAVPFAMSASSDTQLHRSDSVMDTSLSQLQSIDLLAEFTAAPTSSHLGLDASMLQNGNPHITHNLPPVFPNKADHDTMPPSMHVSLPDVSPSINLSTMDVLDSVSSTRTPAPTFTHEFPRPSDAFGMQVLTDEQLPSSAANSNANNAPHISPRNMHSLPPSYSVGTSSLASALDGMCGPARLSPSDSVVIDGLRSTTSPNNPTLGFSSSHFDELMESPGGPSELPHDTNRMFVVEVFRE
jgi:hypothetical protein